MARRSLARMADEYMGSIRRNPPEPVDERIDGFCVAIKSEGDRLSKWTETDWILALERLGVDNGDLASTMEQVASWGVDD